MKMLIGTLTVIAACAGAWIWRAAPEASPERTEARQPAPTQQRTRAQGQLGPGRGTLIVELRPPKGSKLTEGAPVSVAGRGADIQVETFKGKLQLDALPLRVPLVVSDGATGPVVLDVHFYHCRHGKDAPGACAPEKGSMVVDLDLTGDAPGGEAFLAYQAH